MSIISHKTENEMRYWCLFFAPFKRCFLTYNGTDYKDNKITLVLCFEEYEIIKSFKLTP